MRFASADEFTFTSTWSLPVTPIRFIAPLSLKIEAIFCLEPFADALWFKRRLSTEGSWLFFLLFSESLAAVPVITVANIACF